jgi:hypothetical protein
MAESSLAIDSGDIVTLVNGTANTAVDVNTNVSAIVTAFNAALETATGHSHDGTDSKALSAVVAGWTMEEFTRAVLGGLLD